ncbi:MAG TPA: lysyl oxidase family protein, partial [Candidatus Sulfotelmatobacter sp.]|nr:lysyl oxidase family protein [Candidatus Sulfotelmatobacter sp.]
VVYKIAVDGPNGAGGNVTLRWAQASAPLPDLVVLGATANPVVSTETFSASSCAVVEGLVQAGTRRIIRFNTQTANLGTADLLLGNPANNPLFEYAACHGHYHFHNYMAYRLRDTNGVAVAFGQKIGFCILDVAKVDPNAPAVSSPFTCTFQGIHRGWSDIYDHTLDGQWVDITGVPNGNYVLELEVNPAGTLQETDYSKNITYVPISIGGTATAPLNDNFATAQLLVGGSPSTTGSTLNATKQTGEPNHAGNAGGHSVWYQWTALATKSVIVDTVGSSFDTLLAVYTGSSVGALTLVASNDDIGNPTNLQSRVTFNAVAGTVYRIAVDGYNGAVGSLVLTLNQTIDNDNFAACSFEGGTVGSVYGTDVGANKEPGEPNHAGNSGGHSIWYCWTAPLNGSVTFDTLGSTFDTLLAVYTGDTLANLSLVASNDDVSASIKQSQLTFNAIGTTMYHIAIDGYNGASGNVTLHWNLVPSAAAPPLLAGSPAKAPANRPTLTGGISSQGEFQLFLTGAAQQRYRLEMSEDLIHWMALPDPVVATNGRAILTEKAAVPAHQAPASDTLAPGPGGRLDSKARFYRAILLAPD